MNAEINISENTMNIKKPIVVLTSPNKIISISRTIHKVDPVLPEGMWYNFWDGSKIMGAQEIYVDVPYNRIPLFVREGATLTLNLGKSGKVGATVGNDIESTDNYVTVVFDDAFCAEDYCQKLF